MSQIIESTGPFHPGEVAIHTRYGVADDMNVLGKRVIRDHLLDQHRSFYSQLPFVVVGAVNSSGQPWASLLVGGEGFIQSPDSRSLEINALPGCYDPLYNTLSAGSEVGLLGIMLDSRRRNRANGRVVASSNSGFSLQVAHSFGNCPKYIQQRALQFTDDITGAVVDGAKDVVRQTVLSPAMQQLIASSDTLFIASQYQDQSVSSDDQAGGVDVSHRGGKPGFVGVTDESTLLIPDFSGNRFFNTLGNLLVNPKAGLLFVDFETGDLLYLAGYAEVLFDGEEVAAFSGAERMIRFTLTEAIRVSAALPMRGELQQQSPFLKKTGQWE